MVKRLFLIAAIFCALKTANAVPVTPATIPHVTFVDASGDPCAACSLYTYIAGSSTPFATYTDATGTTQNTNPIVLDAAGGANIWLGRASYKFILKDASGSTIWTVDQVNAATLFPCSPAGTIQFSNSGVNGLDCDSNITIDKINHTLNVGTMSVNHVTIGALGTPTTWFFDTTTPATALASIGGAPTGGGTVNSGTINQLAWYAATGTAVSGTSAIPSAITATTQSPSDNSTKLATTAYVMTPGVINPTSVQVGTGVAMTANQGDGIKVQHSTGSATTDNCAKFDAAGNTVDAGISCAALNGTNYVWTFTSCSNNVGQPSQCLGSTTLPGNMPDATYSVHCDVFPGSEPSDQIIVINTWPLPTSSGGTLSYRMVQPMQNGTVGGVAMPVVCYAHHN